MSKKTNRERVYEYKSIIVKLYSEEGRSKSYISRLLEVDRRTLSTIINHEWDLKQAQRRHLTPSNEKFYNKNKQLIAKYLKRGHSYAETAKKLNVTPRYLRTIVEYDEKLHNLVKLNKETRKIEFEKKRLAKIEERVRKSPLDYTEEDLDGEEWVPYRGNPTEYKISNMGRVRSYKKTYDKWALMTPYKNEVVGYNYISLINSKGKSKNIKLSRAVAHHFVEGHSEYRNTVNHINGNKCDDRASNLEWVSQSENNKHSYDYLNREKVRTNQYTTNREKIIYKGKYEFKTVTSLSKFLGKSETQVRRYLKEPERHELEIIYKK